jgi:methionyl-tRNA formyltransferase
MVPGRGGVEPGTIVAVDEQGIAVACGGQGRLEITELQRAGGKRLAAADFLRGFPLQAGQRFEA